MALRRSVPYARRNHELPVAAPPSVPHGDQRRIAPARAHATALPCGRSAPRRVARRRAVLLPCCTRLHHKNTIVAPTGLVGSALAVLTSSDAMALLRSRSSRSCGCVGRPRSDVSLPAPDGPTHAPTHRHTHTRTHTRAHLRAGTQRCERVRRVTRRRRAKAGCAAGRPGFRSAGTWRVRPSARGGEGLMHRLLSRYSTVRSSCRPMPCIEPIRAFDSEIVPPHGCQAPVPSHSIPQRTALRAAKGCAA